MNLPTANFSTATACQDRILPSDPVSEELPFLAKVLQQMRTLLNHLCPEDSIELHPLGIEGRGRYRYPSGIRPPRTIYWYKLVWDSQKFCKYLGCTVIWKYLRRPWASEQCFEQVMNGNYTHFIVVYKRNANFSHFDHSPKEWKRVVINSTGYFFHHRLIGGFLFAKIIDHCTGCCKDR